MKDIKVAVIQASPVLFDKNAALQKVKGYCKKAVNEGAQLVLFPEAYIGDYPRGLGFGTVIGNRSVAGKKCWYNYYMNSIEIPGKETGLLAKWAKEFNLYLNIGVIEREGGTLYCTLLYFTPGGVLEAKHRKIKPTGLERVIWGEGNNPAFDVINTEIGKIGGLICWENYIPEARMELYKKHVEIYLAPTADSRDNWQHSMMHIANEGRCFVLSCNQFVSKSMYPDEFKEELKEQPEIMSRGGSVIVSPTGEILAGPLFGREGVLLADLKNEELVKSKFDFDVAGHYSCPNLFKK